MRTSPTIGAIAAALARAQSELRNPEMNRKVDIKHKTGGGSHSYEYVDLAKLLESVRAAVSKHELCHSFGLTLTPEGPVLTGMLVHSSGEWFASDFPIPPGLDTKTMAAEMTSGKRIQLQALLGVCGESDDDAPSGKPNRVHGRSHEAPNASGGPFQFRMITPASKQGLTEGQISEPQRKRLWAICKTKNWNELQMKEFTHLFLGIDSSHFIHWKDYSDLCAVVENMSPQDALRAVTEAKTASPQKDYPDSWEAPE